jgi:hypothetical protein
MKMSRSTRRNATTQRLIGIAFGALFVSIPMIPKMVNAISPRPLPDISLQQTKSEGSMIAQISPVIQPPQPRTQTPSVAVVKPVDGQVDVSLNNTTNATISYQVVGQTEQLPLEDGEQTELLNLELPVTLTVVRKDEGLIDVKITSSEDGMLEVMLDEEPNLSGSELNIRVQEEGQVLVY